MTTATSSWRLPLGRRTAFASASAAASIGDSTESERIFSVGRYFEQTVRAQHHAIEVLLGGERNRDRRPRPKEGLSRLAAREVSERVLMHQPGAGITHAGSPNAGGIDVSNHGGGLAAPRGGRELSQRTVAAPALRCVACNASLDQAPVQAAGELCTCRSTIRARACSFDNGTTSWAEHERVQLHEFEVVLHLWFSTWVESESDKIGNGAGLLNRPPKSLEQADEKFEMSFPCLAKVLVQPRFCFPKR